MTKWGKVAGDIGDTIHPTLGGITTLTPVDTIEGHLWRKGVVPIDPVVLEAEVLDPDACTITVHLGDADGWLATTSHGRFNIEYQVTFLDGSQFTWPQNGPDEIVVRASGDEVA